ncbi:MAG: hypothetical protein M3O34_07955 [Chloroflexota bacterium]|nr:hypothetical protein [Chloroflexota bacterium]
MFVALFVLTSVRKGGLFSSLFGGMVIVPQSRLLTMGSATTVVAPGVGRPDTSAATPQSAQVMPSTATTVTRKQTENGAVTEVHNGHAGPSHAATVPSETKGNQQIEPQVVDGVKVFELTAQIVRWEVAPAEIIDAWTYNGMVPGPLLPNSQDGVPDATQPVVNPGETFTYEFEAEPPALSSTTPTTTR